MNPTDWIDLTGKIDPSPACRSPNGGSTACREALYARFQDRIVVNNGLSRRLVSYQGNKSVPGFRWMKYKEGFSSRLVEQLLDGSSPGAVLDLFSGIGTTVLTASRTGRRATGMELMPVGNLMAKAVIVIANRLTQRELASAAADIQNCLANGSDQPKYAFPHVRITHGAFSAQVEKEIAKVRHYIDTLADHDMATVLNAACIAAIEDVSYTRKDGQCLRWDPRSGRTNSTRLDKGSLPTLAEAMGHKLSQMIEDAPVVRQSYSGPRPRLIDGSCLTALQRLEDRAFDTVITSPPYANRYDYTRTYALELAYLGYDEVAFKSLRQTLLSATVENRSKREYLLANSENPAAMSRLFAMVDEHPALTEVLTILREQADKLGNRHVIRLLENYFTEMAVVIAEMSRLVAPKGQVFMVNDNVRYHGEEAPVDLILSDFAEQLGFSCKTIWTLPRGKGNSSQQMGRFGRQEIRKCVYHWVRV